MRFAVGQRFYFEDQRVVLPNETPRSGSTSDVLLGADGRLSDAWLAQRPRCSSTSTRHDIERLNVARAGRRSPARLAATGATRRLVDPAGAID